MNQNTKKMPIELHNPERLVFMKEVNFQKFWTFELGTQEGINVPVWIYVVFQQSNRKHDQNINNDTSYEMPVTSCQCIIGTEKYPDSAVLLNYNDDDYSQGYAQLKGAFRALLRDNILQPYISEDDNDDNDIGYIIHSFDTRYQKNLEIGQSVKVEFKLDVVVPA